MSSVTQLIVRVGCLIFMFRSLNWVVRESTRIKILQKKKMLIVLISCAIYVLVIEMPFKIYVLTKLNAFYFMGIEDENK